MQACYAALSDQEKIAANRLVYPRHRQTYVIAHCLLRQVLAHYTNRPAGSFRFGKGSHGRPYLLGKSMLNFNLSHTDGLVACAVFNHRIGVDVERLRDNIDMAALSKRVLNPNERTTLSLQTRPSQGRFFDYWTLKEAYSKALGLGITMPFRDLDFHIDKVGDFRPDLSVVGDESKHWRFCLADFDNAFRIAVAAGNNSQKQNPKIQLQLVNPLTLNIHPAHFNFIAKQTNLCVM